VVHKLTFIIQGPPHPVITNSVLNLQRSQSDVEIIVSGWSHQAELYPVLKGVSYILSADPGSDSDDIFFGIQDNFRRQRLSVLNALENIDENSLVVKTRSDTLIKKGAVESIIQLARDHGSKAYFICSAGSINYTKFPVLFHFSDLIMFANSTKMKSLWNEADVSFSPMSLFDVIYRRLMFGLVGLRGARLACEQRLWAGQNRHVYDSFGFLAHQKHKLLLKEIFIFNEKKHGFELPDRISVSSPSRKYFMIEGDQSVLSDTAFIISRFHPKLAIRWVKSIISVLLLISVPKQYRLRLFKKHKA